MENSNDRHARGDSLSPVTGGKGNEYESEKGQQVRLFRGLPSESVDRLATDNPERAQRVIEIKQAVAEDLYHVESADLADKLRCHPLKR